MGHERRLMTSLHAVHGFLPPPLSQWGDSATPLSRAWGHEWYGNCRSQAIQLSNHPADDSRTDEHRYKHATIITVSEEISGEGII